MDPRLGSPDRAPRQRTRFRDRFLRLTAAQNIQAATLAPVRPDARNRALDLGGHGSNAPHPPDTPGLPGLRHLEQRHGAGRPSLATPVRITHPEIEPLVSRRSVALAEAFGKPANLCARSTP
ncbi:hypothetical protein ACFZAR_35170 [Streptomyces sp. NPDC008222]|uniref:hypothetical protein n=1 Tax=Streptomyces sp. NPDC008222 TaxID=3364820 RepID=UPI0036ED8613